MKVLIVSNDSAGAEILSSWVRLHPKNKYDFVLGSNAEKIFNNRFMEMDIDNQPQSGKMGYVDFTDSKPTIKKKLNSESLFTGNYNEHIHKTESADNLAYARNSDRLINNRSFLEREKDKR